MRDITSINISQNNVSKYDQGQWFAGNSARNNQRLLIQEWFEDHQHLWRKKSLAEFTIYWFLIKMHVTVLVCQDFVT